MKRENGYYWVTLAGCGPGGGELEIAYWQNCTDGSYAGDWLRAGWEYDFEDSDFSKIGERIPYPESDCNK